MTVTAITRTIEYTLDGVTTVFAIPFKWFNDAWITAEVESVALSAGADYTLSGTGESSGSITLTLPGTAGHILLVTRTVPLTQLTRFRNRGTFLADEIEEAADTLTMIAQQLVGGTLVPSGLDASLYVLPAPEANMLIGWNSTATALVNTDRSSVVIDGGGGGAGVFDINAFTELAETPANIDLAVIRDDSDASHKKVTVANLLGAVLGDSMHKLAGVQNVSAEATVQFSVASHNRLQLSSYDTGTYTLTCTAADGCRIDAHAAVVLVSQSPGASGYVAIQLNGATVATDYDKVEADSTSRDLYLQVSTIVNMALNDTVRIRAQSSTAKNLSADTDKNRVMFKELG